MPDVDIDFFDRDGVLKLFKHTPATIIKDNKTEKHKTGVYFHAVPEHPITGHSSLDYKKAELSSSFVFNNPNETERCGCGESFKTS